MDAYLQLGLTAACGGPGADGRRPLLTPAPTRQIVEITGLAEETARRRLQGLVKAGFAERTPAGYAPTWLAGDDASGLRGAMAIGVTRLIGQLARQGS